MKVKSCYTMDDTVVLRNVETGRVRWVPNGTEVTNHTRVNAAGECIVLYDGQLYYVDRKCLPVRAMSISMTNKQGCQMRFPFRSDLTAEQRQVCYDRCMKLYGVLMALNEPDYNHACYVSEYKPNECGTVACAFGWAMVRRDLFPDLSLMVKNEGSYPWICTLNGERDTGFKIADIADDYFAKYDPLKPDSDDGEFIETNVPDKSIFIEVFSSFAFDITYPSPQTVAVRLRRFAQECFMAEDVVNG